MRKLIPREEACAHGHPGSRYGLEGELEPRSCYRAVFLDPRLSCHSAGYPARLEDVLVVIPSPATQAWKVLELIYKWSVDRWRDKSTHRCVYDIYTYMSLLFFPILKVTLVKQK